ncbi:hypothetical protein BD410DRAFT_793870 [Rickenella mellea]|uniref:Uncharacterized protein n=1 Tax=Rickenella mellea TaxID=50990 RepID=A0A4Y7PR32_9AGAM|nr:hypothetical protein BD410DRAFT_793870 [Rickenella mellea]
MDRGGGGADEHLAKLATVISELSDQIHRTRTLATLLVSKSASIKSQAVHSTTGFVLRRFNVHLSQDEYNVELEKMNSSLATENHSLQHDNKQLNTLLKEYEQTLETVMSAFRGRALDVQLRELSIARHYEAQLLARESRSMEDQLSANSALSVIVARVSQRLRKVIRSMNGETPSSGTTPASLLLTDVDGGDFSVGGAGGGEREPEVWGATEDSDWALERECELERLAKENEELRRMIGLEPAGITFSSHRASSILPRSLGSRRPTGFGLRLGEKASGE